MTIGPGRFALLLQHYRAAGGLSQEELAEQAGLSRRGISDLERGRRRTPYPATVRRLANGLGLNDSEYRALLACAHPRPPAEAAVATNSAVLVGRDRELGVLREHLAAAFDQRGSFVLIEGEAGIGKTAVAEALSREARQHGAPVLVGRCFDLVETPPYAPWVDLFAHYDSVEYAVAPPRIFAQRGAIGSVSSSAEILEQCGDFIHTLAAARPVMLLLDDLHWADPAALELLRALAREINALPVLLVATYRPDEPTTSSPLAHLLPTLVREARPRRLRLPPLTPGAIEALVSARYALPDSDTRRLTQYLAQRSDGNPFFLGELIRALEEQGGLVATPDCWRIADIQALRVPPLLRQVIDDRLARFGNAGQTALAIASVIGQEVPIALWQQVGQLMDQDLLPLIEHAVAAHVLIASHDGDAVRFYHALTRDALYDSVLPPRRRAWHRLIAETLAAQQTPAPDAVAHHFERAGDLRATTWLIRAGEQAQSAYAYLTAAERYGAAMQLMGEEESTRGARGRVALRIAWLRFYNDAGHSARRADEVLRLAAVVQDRELSASALFSRGHFLVTLGDFRNGLRDVRAGAAALEALPGGMETWSTMLQTLGLPQIEPFQPRGVLTATLAYCGRFAEARDMGEQITRPFSVSVDDEDEYPVSGMQAYLGLGIAYASLGEPERGRRAFAAARAALHTTTDLFLASVIDVYEFTFAVVMFGADDVAERRRLVARVHAVWARASGMYRVHSDDQLARIAGFLLLFLEGRWNELRAAARQGPLPPPIRFFQYAALGAVVYASGDAEMAWQLVREVLPSGPSTQPGDGAINTQLAYQRLAASLALDAHDLPTARAWLEAHDRFLAWSGSVPGRADGQIAWATYFRAARDLPRSIRHALLAQELAEQPRQPLALIAARRTLGELMLAVGRFKHAEQHLDAALALADDCAVPYERALTLLAQAELGCVTAQSTRAIVALEEAREILTGLGAVPALSRAAAVARHLASDAAPAPPVPAGLTPREVEVLRLIAIGRSNREIADALSVTVHTVHTHLGHIFDKTGCENRSAATAYALRRGLA